MTVARRGAGPSERDIQRTIVGGLRARFPRFVVHAATPPQGGSPAAMRARKSQLGEGWMPGFPDITVIGSGPEHPGELPRFPVCVFLEVKSRTGRLSDAQLAVLDRIRGHGHRAVVVRSLSDAVRAVLDALRG